MLNPNEKRGKEIVPVLNKQARRKDFLKKYLPIVLGAAILSFGMYNVHKQTDITEGGVLGAVLLIDHWTGISPAIVTPILDILCYTFAVKYLGKNFLKLSLVSTLSFAGFYKLWEMFPPVLPNLSNWPLIAAIIGGLFVGVGVGLVVRRGASCGGDDALALVISKLTKCRISRAYLFTDIVVLALSLSYLPWQRIAFSLVTVTISSFTIDFVQNFGKPKADNKNAETGDDKEEFCKKM